MRRCDGRYIVESEDVVVFVDFARRNFAAHNFLKEIVVLTHNAPSRNALSICFEEIDDEVGDHGNRRDLCAFFGRVRGDDGRTE